MGAHRPQWRRIKVHRSYTVDEAARTLVVCKETVRRWRKAGLPFLDDLKPAIVMGQELKAFGNARGKPKQKCQAHECYCFHCRAPREAAGGMADFVPMNATNGNLRAICTVCHSNMCKRVSKASLAALAALLDVTIRQAGESLTDTASPCPTVDLKRGSKKWPN